MSEQAKKGNSFSAGNFQYDLAEVIMEAREMVGEDVRREGECEVCGGSGGWSLVREGWICGECARGVCRPYGEEDV